MAIRKTLASIGLLGALAVGIGGACGQAGSGTSLAGGTGGTGTTSGPPCKPGGASCQAFSECCSGSCNNQVCTTCAQPGESCGSDGDCCSGLDCKGGVCTKPPCAGDSAPCTLASECCSNTCTDGACDGSCSGVGSPCSSDAFCCSKACIGGVCAVCAGNGSACSTDAGCCSGACHAGTCQCDDQANCYDWFNEEYRYVALCPGSQAKAQADALIACLCGACASTCGGAAACQDAFHTDQTSVPCANCAQDAIVNFTCDSSMCDASP